LFQNKLSGLADDAAKNPKWRHWGRMNSNSFVDLNNKLLDAIFGVASTSPCQTVKCPRRQTAIKYLPGLFLEGLHHLHLTSSPYMKLKDRETKQHEYNKADAG
jgi:hypothetical protein